MRKVARKVALINPGRDRRFAIQEPLNLGFLAAYLEKHDVCVTIIDELAGQDVGTGLNSFQPHIVGLTATTPLVPDAYRIAQMCRQRGILTVMGGVHASVLPEEALRHVDVVVRGEGEKALLHIVRERIASGIVSLPYVRDLDEIPPPARHLMDMEFYLTSKDRLPESYLHFVPPGARTASLITSRGCPYDCLFCHNTWKDAPYRFHTPERVVSEIKALIREYRMQALFFIEDNLFVNRQRLGAICRLMKEEGLEICWGGNARVDNLDEETLASARDAGCRQITFGFESGSQRILDILRKGTTVEQNRRAIEACHRAGIIPQGTFMIGNPTETLEDLTATKRFILENDLPSVGVCLTTAYPGTSLWDWCMERGLLPDRPRWRDFTYDRVPVRICREVSPRRLRELKWEIESLHFLKRRGPLRLRNRIQQGVRHPWATLKNFGRLLMRPHMLGATLRRIAR